MKLFSPFSKVIPISLTSGHSFVVTQEPVEVPEAFVAEARSRGALEADEAGSSNADGASHQATGGSAVAPTPEELAALRVGKIKEALNSMLDGANESDFTADGKPQLNRLKAITGFAVARAEADAVWAEVSANL